MNERGHKKYKTTLGCFSGVTDDDVTKILQKITDEKLHYGPFTFSSKMQVGNYSNTSITRYQCL